MGVFPSPLEPTHHLFPSNPPFSPFSRPSSRGSSTVNRVPSEEIRALAGCTTPGTRTSCMILYRRAEPEDCLPPPSFPGYSAKRASSQSDMQVSLSSDSKYPIGLVSEHGLVAYAYDPSLDERKPMDEEDMLHNPDVKTVKIDGPMSWRGVKNFGMLVTLIAALLGLFIAYPVYNYIRNGSKNNRIIANTRINATGQAVERAILPRNQLPIPIRSSVERIDPYTPEDAKIRDLSNGVTYTLIFSDEFETALSNEQWYSPNHVSYEHDLRRVTTSDGNLVIKMDESSLDTDQRANVVLRQRDPLCLADRGYIEISAKLPHTTEYSRFFWSHRWSTCPDDQDVSIEATISRPPAVVTISFGIPPGSSPSPVLLMVDYVRLYQRREDEVDLSCVNSSKTELSFPW